MSAYEDSVILRVDCEPGGSLHSIKRKVLLDLESFWIEDRYFVLVLKSNINQAILARSSTFSIAAHIHGANDITGRRIDRRNVVRVMVVCEYPLRPGVEINAVRSLAHIYLLDHGQIPSIKHRAFVFLSIPGVTM